MHTTTVTHPWSSHSSRRTTYSCKQIEGALV
jgi:hypothetical protein